METGSRLSERIRFETNDNYGRGTDTGWIQFIRDHKQYLRDNSPVKTYAVLDLLPFKYRPEEFYVSVGGKIDMAWIFMFVNDLRDVTDFNESLNQLWVVDPSVIVRLRRLYESSASYQLAQSEQ